MVSIPQIGQTIQNVKRYHEVLGVLIRHGFNDFVVSTGLDQRLGLEKTALNPGPKAKNAPRAERIKDVLEELGPTFIKLGQIMSTRPDLIPPEWAEELKKLQDNCAPLEFEQIQTRLDEEFGENRTSLFQSIETERLATASMAQVHRAILRDGSQVVLKILRPGIQDVIRTDLDILRGFAEFAERHFQDQGYSATEVVEEFARELSREMDLSYEGRSTDRLRKYFENDKEVFFPKVFWPATTKNILALQEVKGEILSRVDPSRMSSERRTKLASIGTRAILRQCLEFGFFHADPHPGNIFIGENDTLWFVDCGMTGHIDESTAEQLADLVIGVSTADLEKVLLVMQSLTQAEPGKVLDRRIRSETWDLISRFQQSSLDQLHFGEILQDFFHLLGRNKLKLPSDIVFLIKAITTIEGVGTWLAPEFDAVQCMKPYVQQLVDRRYGFAGMRKRTQRTLMRYLELAEDLPGELQSLLAQLRGNHLSINLEHKGLDRLTNTIEYASANISVALIAFALLTAAAILILASAATPAGNQLLQSLGFFGLGAGVFGVFVLIARFIRFRKK